jgi:hypothetical protein
VPDERAWYLQFKQRTLSRARCSARLLTMRGEEQQAMRSGGTRRSLATASGGCGIVVRTC